MRIWNGKVSIFRLSNRVIFATLVCEIYISLEPFCSASKGGASGQPVDGMTRLVTNISTVNVSVCRGITGNLTFDCPLSIGNGNGRVTWYRLNGSLERQTTEAGPRLENFTMMPDEEAQLTGRKRTIFFEDVARKTNTSSVDMVFACSVARMETNAYNSRQQNQLAAVFVNVKFRPCAPAESTRNVLGNLMPPASFFFNARTDKEHLSVQADIVVIITLLGGITLLVLGYLRWQDYVEEMEEDYKQNLLPPSRGEKKRKSRRSPLGGWRLKAYYEYIPLQPSKAF